MPKFNDLNLKNWQDLDIWTDSLWIIPRRDRSGKHSNFFHGNFVPQIPYQLISRYTKKDEVVLDPFIGSGTTAYEAERLERNCIGVDLQQQLVEEINKNINTKSHFIELLAGDSADLAVFEKVKQVLQKHSKQSVQLVILHPPYFDILKFSDNENDLSNAKSLKDFLNKFEQVARNAVSILEKNRYLAVVIGDKYTKGEWIPLGFYCMYTIKKNLGLTLKGLIIKNMTGNIGKRNKESIWRYRALSSDYYIFKHEYIFVFKY